jgi:hypothetical protein
MARPLLVYLDSSDFSRLSNPKRLPAEEELRRKLCAWADDAQVTFVFSAAHLTEMAPLAPKYTSAATARTETLVRLCKRNALLAFDRVLKAELKALVEDRTGPASMHSTVGEWYPEWGSLMSPVRLVDTLKEELAKIAAETGWNRQMRRTLQGRLLGSNRLKAAGKNLLGTEPNEAAMRSLLQHYPMRERDLKVLWRYVVGRATTEEADAAFMESLRDPRFMMQWFAEHYGHLSPLVEWVRKPSENLTAVFRALSEKMKRLREMQAALGMESPRGMSDAQWGRLREDSLCGVVRRMALECGIEGAESVRPADVIQHCPGLSSAVATLMSVMRDLISPRQREACASDFVDAMHAMYAPYVAVFRADSYMAPHIARANCNSGTTVVAKLGTLVEEVERLLSRRE